MASAKASLRRRAADQDDVVVPDALGLFSVLDDDLHVGHGRGQQRRHAEDVRLVLLERFQVCLDGIVDPDVDHLETGALHHHRDKVLADVVDVALDRADHHLADLGRAGLGQQRPQDRHAALHRVGREQDLGHEEDAVAEVDPDDPHALDQGLGQDPVRLPAALEQDVDALHDLLLEAVVEVVLHLLDQFVVVERAEIEIVVAVTHGESLSLRGPGRRLRSLDLAYGPPWRRAAFGATNPCESATKASENQGIRSGLSRSRLRDRGSRRNGLGDRRAQLTQQVRDLSPRNGLSSS